jgi:hypothetical protein
MMTCWTPTSRPFDTRAARGYTGDAAGTFGRPSSPPGSGERLNASWCPQRLPALELKPKLVRVRLRVPCKLLDDLGSHRVCRTLSQAIIAHGDAQACPCGCREYH